MTGHGQGAFGPENPVRPGRSPSLETIALGDVVTIRGERMVYAGEIMLSEDGCHWQELRLAGSPERYLGVEYTPEPELTLWSAAPAPGVEPGPRSLEVGGRRYHREERGTARFRAVNVPGLPEHGTCDYVDYAAEDGRLMSFERFQGGPWEVSFGVPVDRSEVEVTAGSGPA